MKWLSQRRSGVLLHPTSLPGPHGAGDFGPAARHFVDWLCVAGQTVWQMLPTNPPGAGHSPYQSVSSFAGSAAMVALEPLVERGWLAPPTLPEGGFTPRRVDAARVGDWRLQQLRQAAAGFERRASTAEREALQAFRDAQQGWIDDYLLFMALEAEQQGRAWWDWPAPLRDRDPSALAQARQRLAAELRFHAFVQWQFDEQARSLRAYAGERGVLLLGDLPIFVAHHSADCWSRPDLYWLDAQGQPMVVAGVPPDELSSTGQRWGNPLYRWDRMAAEQHAWWAARVRRALELADLLRIDHFIGFSRYWAIPAHEPGATVGQWCPGPGRVLFDDIAAALGSPLSELPIVAEDLGLVTPEVAALRDGCGFPGMKIVSFAFGGDGAHEFLPHQHPPHCVAYPGTHDNDTLLGWWRTASARERAFLQAYCGAVGAGEAETLWALLRAIANSPARTVVFPMQDLLGLDGRHRMNLPGTMGGDNWAWRFDWDMVGPEPARRLGALAAASGRAPIALLGLP